MLCSKCGADNPDGKRFCGDCGAAMQAAQVTAAVPEEDGAFYCSRHKNTVTRVRCGRCDSPICPRCTVYGPAGTRCRDCARNRVPIRPLGVLHQASRPLESPGAMRTVWYMALWAFVISIFSDLLGGRRG